MTAIKKVGSEYYLVKKHKWKKSRWTTIFPVRATDKKHGSISDIISCPEELVGKKVRLKVEFVEDERDRKK